MNRFKTIERLAKRISKIKSDYDAKNHPNENIEQQEFERMILKIELHTKSFLDKIPHQKMVVSVAHLYLTLYEKYGWSEWCCNKLVEVVGHNAS